VKIHRLYCFFLVFFFSAEEGIRGGSGSRWVGNVYKGQGEGMLRDPFYSPFWVVSQPKDPEAFSYRIDPDDKQCSMTADLIIPGGYGELLGIAEKITDERELLERMKEKRKDTAGPHRWLLDLRRYGCVPHSGMGMGFERLLRWLFQGPQVREFVAFPRIFGRAYWP